MKTQVTKNQQAERASQLTAALDLLAPRVARAEKLRDQLIAETQRAEGAAEAARRAVQEVNAMDARAKAMSRDLEQGLDGAAALLRVGLPELAAQLPAPPSLATFDLHIRARELSTALRGGPKRAHALAELVEEGARRWLALARRDQREAEALARQHQARTDSRRLTALIKQAETLILESSPPGSPALDVLKRPARKPPTKARGTPGQPVAHNDTPSPDAAKASDKPAA